MAKKKVNPKRITSTPLVGDEVQSALAALEKAIKQPMKPKNAAAVALGRLGGKKGGPARKNAMTPEQRIESAKKAANSRWAKHRRPDS